MENAYEIARKKYLLQESNSILEKKKRKVSLTYKNTLAKLFFSPWLQEDIQREWMSFIDDDSEFKSATISVDKFDYKVSHRKGLIFDMEVSFISDDGIKAVITDTMLLPYFPNLAMFDSFKQKHKSKVNMTGTGDLMKKEIIRVKKELEWSVATAMENTINANFLQKIIDEVQDKAYKDYEKEAKKELKRSVEVEDYDGVFIGKLVFKATDKFLDSYFQVLVQVKADDEEADNGSIFYDVHFKMNDSITSSKVTKMKMRSVTIGER